MCGPVGAVEYDVRGDALTLHVDLATVDGERQRQELADSLQVDMRRTDADVSADAC